MGEAPTPRLPFFAAAVPAPASVRLGATSRGHCFMVEEAEIRAAVVLVGPPGPPAVVGRGDGQTRLTHRPVHRHHHPIEPMGREPRPGPIGLFVAIPQRPTDEVPALPLNLSSRRGRFLDGHEAEEVLVERQRESAGGGVVYGPGGADEVGDTPLEERFGETRGQFGRAQLSPVGRDPRLAGVGEDELRDVVDPPQLVDREPLAAGENPAGRRGVLGVVDAVAGVVEHIVGAQRQLAEHVGPRGLARPQQLDDLDTVRVEGILGLGESAPSTARPKASNSSATSMPSCSAPGRRASSAGSARTSTRRTRRGGGGGSGGGANVVRSCRVKPRAVLRKRRSISGVPLPSGPLDPGREGSACATISQWIRAVVESSSITSGTSVLSWARRSAGTSSLPRNRPCSYCLSSSHWAANSSLARMTRAGSSGISRSGIEAVSVTAPKR